MPHVTTRAQVDRDPDIDQIAALTGTGLPARTASNTWALRQLAVGTGLSVANPAGVAGNPTVSVHAANMAGEVRAELLSDAIADGETGKAPTQNAVFDALAGKFAVGGDASALPVTATDGETNTLSEWMARLRSAAAKRWSTEAYEPTITPVTVVDTSGVGYLYRHVASLLVKSETHLAEAHLLNNSSQEESQSGQHIAFTRSADNGDTWSAEVEELNDGDTCTNPLDPDNEAGGSIQGEPFIHYDAARDLEVLAFAHRGGTYNRGLIARRDAGVLSAAVNKWTVSGVLFDTTTNAPELSTTTSGEPPSGKKWTYTIDGTEFQLFFYKGLWLDDGRLALPCVFVTTFGVLHRVAIMFLDGETLSMGGVVPQGEAAAGGPWEPALWQTANGAYRFLARNLGAAGTSRLIESVSGDLLGWSAWVTSDEDARDKRHIRTKARSDLWLGVSRADDTGKHNHALWASGDGEQWVHGLSISQEENTSDEAIGYGDIVVRAGTVYALWSEQLAQDAEEDFPNTIKFARFPLPDDGALPLMGSWKNYYELGAGVVPTVSDDVLTIPPEMMGSLTSRGHAWLRTIRVCVTAAPTTHAYDLYSVGNEETGYFRLRLADDGGTTRLYVVAPDGETVMIRAVAAPTQYFSAQIAVWLSDQGWRAYAFGVTALLGRYAREYLGDTDTGAGGAQAGDILIDASGCTLSEFEPDSLSALVRAGAYDATFDDLHADSLTVDPPTGPAIVSSKSADDVADVVADAGTGKVGTLRVREDGSTRASLTYDPTVGSGQTRVRGMQAGALADILLARSDRPGALRANIGFVPQVLAASAVAASHTGDTNETTLASVSIPAGRMGPSGYVIVTVLWSYTNSGNNKTLRVRFGGAGGTEHLANVATASATSQQQRLIQNRGAANSQVSYPGAAGATFATSGVAPTTGAVDTTSAVDILFRAQLANAGETITLEAYSVEIVYGA